ncbi:MAG: PEP-CTERM sorting domain-containing protein [Myxococcota bacterium]|nr:PEP-CTERM sorting domain-containing protein [Myxococcota bacterium]
MFKGTLGGLIGLALLLMPLGASAGTIYNFTSGSAVVSADIVSISGSTPVLLNGSPTVSVDLIGDFVEFDDTLGVLNDFLIQLDDTGILNLSPSVFGYVSAELNGVELAPGTGYDGSTGVSGGPSNFTLTNVGPVSVTGSLNATSGSPPLPPDIVGLPIDVMPQPDLNGSISVDGNMIELLGITLGAIANPLNPGELLVFKGDIVFNAAVPEPAIPLLLATALSALVLRRRR